MIGCLWTHVHKQPIITLYFESENILKLYNLEARFLQFYVFINAFKLSLLNISSRYF